MKPRIATALTICCACVAVFAQEPLEGRFWIPTNIHWNHPRGAPPDEAVASVVVLYFEQNGLFARDECSAIRKGKSVTISDGDPHNEWIGRWTPILDGMHITSRLVRRTVDRKGESLPGKEVESDVDMPKSGLKIGHQLFRSVVPSNAAEYAARYKALANNAARN
jgi:hypothetical protein